MYVFRIAHKQVMSGRFNFLILIVKDQVETATLPAELRLYLSKISLITVCNEVAKVMFLQGVSVHGGGGSASVDTGIPPPSGSKRPPLLNRQPPPGAGTPPGSRHTPPPRETTTASDGTHPTGMHSCSELICINSNSNVDLCVKIKPFIVKG